MSDSFESFLISSIRSSGSREVLLQTHNKWRSFLRGTTLVKLNLDYMQINNIVIFIFALSELELRAATILLLFDSMRFDFLPLRFDFFDSIHWSDEKQ